MPLFVLLSYITASGVIVSNTSLIDVPIYDVQVVSWFDGLPKQQFDKLIMHPVETGSAIEFRNSKDQHDEYTVFIRDMDDIHPVVEEKRGLLGTKDDMLVELKFREKDSRQERLVRFNVKDKDVNRVILLAKGSKELEDVYKYWDTVNLQADINGKQEIIKLYYKTPFLGRGEKLLWHTVEFGGLFSRKVARVQAITRYRVLEYDYRSHKIAATLHNYVSDIIVTNKKRVTESTTHGTTSRTRTSKTIGDVVFMMDGRPHVTFSRLEDPDGVAEIGRAARKNADFTIPKEQGAISSATSSQSVTCPKCNDTNPADAKFCNNCGTKFSFVCVKCNKVNPHGASFCGHCGTPLS